MSDSASPLLLHLGAHRTGTTRLQAILDQNSGVLARSGLLALTPPYEGKRDVPTVRDAIRMAHRAIDAPFAKKLWSQRRCRIEMSRWAKSGPSRQLLLSDENILGLPFDRKTGEALYPRLESYLDSALPLLPVPVSRAYMSIRPYADFLVSVYAMTAVYGGVVAPFGEIKDRLLAVNRRWVDVIRIIKSKLPHSHLTVWCFGEVSLSDQLVDLLGAELAGALQFDSERRVNSAPTIEAMTYAQAHPYLTPSERDDVIRQFRDGEPFSPLTTMEKRSLNNAYYNDLRTIRAIPEIRLVP